MTKVEEEKKNLNPGGLTLGLSPCPNDTYIFHALLHGLVRASFDFSPYMADVEYLNSLARNRAIEVTKLSLGVVPHVMGDYALLASGAALGWGVGPLLVARKPLERQDWRDARIAVPGLMTTANLLLDLHGGFQGERREMLFGEVMPAVLRGEADMGVIIHEGRFTYEGRGLVKIMDMGEWWEGAFHMPLPLGAIAVRRDVPQRTALDAQRAVAESLAHANRHPEVSREFIRAHAQELEEQVMLAHIRTFVTDFSYDLGQAGRAAIEQLVSRAAGLRGLEMPAGGLFLNAGE